MINRLLFNLGFIFVFVWVFVFIFIFIFIFILACRNRTSDHSIFVFFETTTVKRSTSELRRGIEDKMRYIHTIQ